MDHSFITAAAFRMETRSNVQAVLLIGSAAYREAIVSYDDFDVVVFTKTLPAQRTYYEIIRRQGKTFLLSIYFVRLNNLHPKTPSVLDQPGVEPLFSRENILQCIFIKKPRRTEPLPSRLPDFSKMRDRYFEIFVDCAFILQRYELRGHQLRTKARLARKALKTISRHFYAHYGSKNAPSAARARWRSVVKELVSFLLKTDFPERSRNPQLIKAFQAMIPSFCAQRAPFRKRKKTHAKD